MEQFLSCDLVRTEPFLWSDLPGTEQTLKFDSVGTEQFLWSHLAGDGTVFMTWLGRNAD